MADGLSFVAFRPGPGLAEHIASHIEQQIVSGLLKSDERVQEARVVDDLKVSRGSVREAFRVLERRRLIELVPRRGALVAKLSPSRVGDLNYVLHTLMQAIGRDVSIKWNQHHVEQLDQALVDSKAKFTQVNPACAFRRMSFLHPNRAMFECMVDLLPTLDRIFAKLVRQQSHSAAQIEHDILHALVPALTRQAPDEVCSVLEQINRSIERKYLETLERTG